ncbi:protein O-GlcNAcase [Gracilibacillus salitolerans]|uniref:protein O-GlcNAcase n=1 Tax=Gracilibacillus salitolerans TaxID=2663022 RepID=UPI00189173B3|nr:protein O-GlcNAcase [Gracilibacillus salitolerans]
MSAPFFEKRGVLEGFYGAFYTESERNDLIHFMYKHDFNFYIYGPKNDRQHRARWREPYPDYIMKQFGRTIQLAKKLDIDFCYSIGSGVSINYASDDEVTIIKEKFKAFYDIGVRSFAIMLDDIAPNFRTVEEQEKFNSFAEAQSFLCNHLYHWLKELNESCTLFMCPTDYHGQAPFSDYIHELGELLDPNIDVCYTGADITTAQITNQDTKEFGEAIRRSPIIWENYPVNDLAMTSEMHLGPITGRDPNLYETTKGFLVNTMNQAEASKVPLLTFKAYLKDPHSYEPWKEWNDALKEIAGTRHAAFLKTFAENALQSCLKQSNSKTLSGLMEEIKVLLTQQAPITGTKATQDLIEYLNHLDETGYHLKFRMENEALRNDLLPWIELMESWAWAGRRAIWLLEALEKNEGIEEAKQWFIESSSEVEKHPKEMTDGSLQVLIDYANQQMRRMLCRK